MSYEDKKRRLVEQLRSPQGGAPLGLAKDTSNLFRDRSETPKRKLDVRAFNEVLQVNAAEGWVEVEGMTPYAKLVDAMLPHGVMPAVVPQLKSITIGGAAAGVGIEASSFKYGLVHETLLELEILLPGGGVVLATPDNEYSDLFYGFPNSYGTMGYVLKLKTLTVPVKPYVRLTHTRYTDAAACFHDLEVRCNGDADFVDGVVFGPNDLVITQGHFVDAAPFTSDYTYEHIYYRSLREREIDYLTVRDFIWRWDTDWFWCSKSLGMQNPVIRRLVGRKRLNSVFYTRLMRLNSRWALTRNIDRLLGLQGESVIQDVDIPIAHAPAFLEFLLREIGILPVWLCPVRSWKRDARFTMYPMDADTLYVNFGFWDVVRRRQHFASGHHNRLVEQKVSELNGIKSLYSDSYYDPEMFWRIYNGPAYNALKQKYDPDGNLKDLYQKCVLRQ
ncbi:MAG: FAD-binding oxidoreductase [Thiobacillaceae bacterium]